MLLLAISTTVGGVDKRMRLSFTITFMLLCYNNIDKSMEKKSVLWTPYFTSPE